MNVSYWVESCPPGRPGKPRRLLAAALVGLLAGFFVLSAPHLVHHIGEHSKATGQCPVSILLQTVSGLLPPIPDISVYLVIAWVFIVGSLPLLLPVHTVSYYLRAPPASVPPLISS